MRTEPGSRTSSLLWQEVRARAIDDHLEADRRAGGERTAAVFRWLFVIVFAGLNNWVGLAGSGSVVGVNVTLVTWSVANLGISAALWRRYRPGRRFSASTLLLDGLVAASVLYFGRPGESPYFQAFVLLVVLTAIRLGTVASLAAAVVAALLYITLGHESSVAVEAGTVFLYFVVATSSAYLTVELERERRMAVARAAQADALREMSVNMASSLDIKEVFMVILEHALRITVAERGSMLVVLDQQVQVAAGDSDPGSETAAVDVAARGEAAFLNNRTALLVPMASGDGVTAVLCLRGGSSPFTNEDLFMVNALAGSSAVPLANALRYQRSTEDATTDGLTGLLNQREFRRRLEAEFARRQHRASPLSLMLIDLDHFKSVNDSMGHQHGDGVIRAAAKVVRQTARSHDLVARYGGDEMAVILTDAGEEGASALAARISEALRKAAIVASPGRHLTVSIGVASYPDDSVYVEELVMAADQALYLAKREGRDRWAACGTLVRRLKNDPELILNLLQEAGPQVMVAAGHALDARSGGMRWHSGRVAALAEALALATGLSHQALEDLRAAAFLHEVGAVLDGGEAERHPELGAQILTRSPFSAGVVGAVRHHHERWDGAGYPDRLAGSGIPVEARIIAVADRFERLTAGRDDDPLHVLEALEELEAEDGAYDPELVTALRVLVLEGHLALAAPNTLAASRV